MRILFTPLALPSHVWPMVSLAWACRSAGHDVRFAAQPRVLDVISRAGLIAVPLGTADGDFLDEAVAFMRQHPSVLQDPANLVTVMNEAAPGTFRFPWISSAEAVVPDLIAFAAWWRPDLVITDPMFYAGPLIADVLGVPLVRHMWGPDWTKSGFGMGGYTDGQPPARWPDALTRLYESYGARTAVDFAACTLDPFPPSMQIPGLTNRVSMQYVPYNGAGQIPEWLAEPPERPRVCVTWGTSTTGFMGDGAFLVPQILDVLGDMPIEVVLAIATSDRGRLANVPANVRVVENLPLDVMLSSCSGIINQGGGSTVATAAVHGVPQVVIPQMADQPANAALIAATGAGTALASSTLDPERLRSATAEVVFGRARRAAAARLQEEIHGLPTPTAITGILEHLVATATLPAAA